MARAVVLIALLVGCGRIGFDDLAAGDGGGDAPLPTGRWQSVALGPGSACGITITGELWCWGHGNYGQLGIGGTPELSPPTRVGTDADWLGVSIDEQHACGIRAGGSLWCWGRNTNGALGYGVATEQADVPRQVSPGSVWKQVQAGRYFTCAIRDDDTLWCWGANGAGQLGISSFVDQPRPITTAPIAATWTALALGDATACAIRTDRSLWCWGDNVEGQVGDTTTVDRTVPTPVMPGTMWTAVDVGYQHTCALDANGEAWCWGRNYEGELGDGTVTRRPMPSRVVGGKPFARIATGGTHSCAATADGELWCWGEGTRGRISGIDAIELRVPQQLAAPRVSVLEAEDAGTCVVDAEAHLFCTGANAGGQLGIQPPGEHHTFERADTRTDWSKIYAQISHGCGLTTAGAAWCWGRGCR
jgi:alpha-tubulin suppressor-like RCC1 family protein